MRKISGSLHRVTLLCFIVVFSVAQNLFAQYCAPSNVRSNNTYYISNVTLGSIDNSSTGTTGGYTYFSNVPTTDIEVGETIEGTVTVRLNGRNRDRHTLIVWMDFNNDGDFEDSGEEFTFTVQSSTNVSGLKTIDVPISIPVPSTAQLGSSIMRIGFRQGTSTNYTSCNYRNKSGEVEDYNINFVSSLYCTPSNVNNYNIYYISNVSLGAIDNSSSRSTDGYEYYESISAGDVAGGETLTGTITATLNGWDSNTNTVMIWMDFNNDGDFEDSGEQFEFTFSGGSYSAKTEKTVDVPVSIPVPENVTEGPSIIRIALMAYTSPAITSCDFA